MDVSILMMFIQPLALAHFSLNIGIGILTPPLHDVSTECARCGLVQYCSRECQKRDWKQHKIECRKSEDGDKAALYKKIQSRLFQFDDLYSPIINRLVLDWYRLYNKEMDTGDILFPEDTIVDIRLADLPQSAKRPRLYIKHVRIAKLTKYEIEAAFSRVSLPMPGCERVRYCLSYSYGPGKNDIFNIFHQFQSQVDSAVRSEFNRGSKQLYLENTHKHQDFINSVAKGENPKIYKVIKEILKENNG